MPAPAVLRDVFRALRAELGEEDTGYTYDGGPGPLSRVDVMVYAAADFAGRTTFATVGMAVEPMPARGGRAELRLFRRGPVDARDQEAISRQLANLVAYPWTTGRPLNWGEIVTMDQPMPTFPGCRRMFLAGPWIQGQLDHAVTAAGPVQIINVVPISEAERATALASDPVRFFGDLLDTRDVLAPPIGTG